jgi:hypothetical protein
MSILVRSQIGAAQKSELPVIFPLFATKKQPSCFVVRILLFESSHKSLPQEDSTCASEVRGVIPGETPGAAGSGSGLGLRKIVQGGV